MKLIDKAALVAEINRRIKILQNLPMENHKTICHLDSLKQALNTLEVKEVDLEKETKKWWKEHLHLDPKNQLWMDAHQSIFFAKHFFNLGLKAQKGE